MPPPSRMTDSAMVSRSSVETPGVAACWTALSAFATRAPAAAMASSSSALRWGTTLRPRRPGRPIIDACLIGSPTEDLQRPREHLVQRANGVDGLELGLVVVQQRSGFVAVDLHAVENDLLGVVGATPALESVEELLLGDPELQHRVERGVARG